MKAQLRKIWESRSPRDRAIIIVITVIVGAVLYWGLVQSGGRTHARLRESVAMLRTQANQVEQQAAELKRVRATPIKTASQTDLRTLIQTQIATDGLSGALVKIDAPDANQVVVVFSAVAFAGWLNWVAHLNSQQVMVDSCRVEALTVPGSVNVTATLLRSGKQ